MAELIPKTMYARDGDVHVAWQAVGEGPVDLLLTPGYISHLDLNWTLPAFAAFVEYLSRFSRVILFDKRGTGLSDRTPDAIRFERRMRDIELILDAAGSERAVLFGMSEGGPLASLFAATHPERVESLILFGTFARGSIIDREVILRFERAVDRWGEGHTAGIFLVGSDGPVARRFIGLFERAAASPGIARALLVSIVACDVSGVLPELHVPTLVLHRRDDPFARAAWSDELEHLIPNVTRCELPGADHLPWMGAAAELVRALEEWITGSPPHAPTRRRFATVLFTDIVASTDRLAREGDEGWARIIQAHNNECRDVFERNEAWSVKSTGDGFMACFDTPEAAVRCTFDLHRNLEGMGVEIRAGLHSGEVERVDLDDVAGMAVHIAARVSELADAGQTLATRVLSDQLVGSRVNAREVGTHQLRGVPGAIAIVDLQRYDATIDLTAGVVDLLASQRLADTLTLRLAARAPGLMRRLARLTGAN